MNAIAVFDPNSSFNSARLKGTFSIHQCFPSSTSIISIKISGLNPNSIHAIHIHTLGDLTEGCKSVCDHYNPLEKLHGSINIYGSDRHVGDTCSNIISDKDGNVDYTYEDELVDLYGEYSVLGRSVVIHEKPDDLGIYRYDQDSRGKGSATTGNAGGRIACSVIGRSSTKGQCQPPK